MIAYPQIETNGVERRVTFAPYDLSHNSLVNMVTIDEKQDEEEEEPVIYADAHTFSYSSSSVGKSSEL